MTKTTTQTKRFDPRRYRVSQGVYHVNANRFSGEYGLCQAIAWAKRCAKAEPSGRFILTNEFGTVLLRTGEKGGAS